jgi:hypothetical protein
LGAAAPAAAEDEVRVCVVVILASERDNKVDKKLECIAKEVQKTNPRLTGFHLKTVSCESLAVGARHDFKLLEEQVAAVSIEPAAETDKPYRIKVTPPQMGQITYTCRCGKFLPIMTPFRTKDNEVLILAVRVAPCQQGK